MTNDHITILERKATLKAIGLAFEKLYDASVSFNIAYVPTGFCVAIETKNDGIYLGESGSDDILKALLDAINEAMTDFIARKEKND